MMTSFYVSRIFIDVMLGECLNYAAHIWHAYSTNDALSNGTNVNDICDLDFDLEAKNSFLDFVVVGGIPLQPGAYCSVSQTHLDFSISVV